MGFLGSTWNYPVMHLVRVTDYAARIPEYIVSQSVLGDAPNPTKPLKNTSSPSTKLPQPFQSPNADSRIHGVWGISENVL